MPDFPALQSAVLRRATAGLLFYAFDLIAQDGEDLRAWPLLERKAALKKLLRNAPERVIAGAAVLGAAAAACRYTSVLPLPVGPCTKTWPPSASSRATMRSTLATCSGVSSAGSGSPPSASRAPGSLRAPRRRAMNGATSASARAGVEP